MLDWFAKRWGDLLNFLYSLILSIYDALHDFACFIFESLLNIVLTSLDALGSILSAMDVSQYLTFLPDEVKNTMALVGISDASVIIVTAITIRILLQLIPFTRLGS
ncbi:VSK receptor [Aeromonas veronii]|uniref:VSK receptor n=1 Tax=Aeromonas veronii TaxID=654 RepID=UPI0031589212